LKIVHEVEGKGRSEGNGGEGRGKEVKGKDPPFKMSAYGPVLDEIMLT